MLLVSRLAGGASSADRKGRASDRTDSPNTVDSDRCRCQPGVSNMRRMFPARAGTFLTVYRPVARGRRAETSNRFATLLRGGVHQVQRAVLTAVVGAAERPGPVRPVGVEAVTIVGVGAVGVALEVGVVRAAGRGVQHTEPSDRGALERHSVATATVRLVGLAQD